MKFIYFKTLEGKTVTKIDRTINFEINYMDFYSVFTYTSKIEIHIHSSTWSHTIADVYGDISFEKKWVENSTHFSSDIISVEDFLLKSICLEISNFIL